MWCEIKGMNRMCVTHYHGKNSFISCTRPSQMCADSTLSKRSNLKAKEKRDTLFAIASMSAHSPILESITSSRKLLFCDRNAHKFNVINFHYGMQTHVLVICLMWLIIAQSTEFDLSSIHCRSSWKQVTCASHNHCKVLHCYIGGYFKLQCDQCTLPLYGTPKTWAFVAYARLSPKWITLRTQDPSVKLEYSLSKSEKLTAAFSCTFVPGCNGGVTESER